MINFARDPLLFVVLSALTFFAWGEVYSLFPATCGGLFGRKFATTTDGLPYTAKGTASLLVPIGSVIAGSTGNWLPIFMLAVAFDLISTLLALFVLKPLRICWVAGQAAPPSMPVASPPAAIVAGD